MWLKRAYINILSKGREEVETYFLINSLWGDFYDANDGIY